MRAAGAQLVPVGHPSYPEPLRRIFDPPPVLFARGRIELLSSICLGVVGTRHPTPYGVVTFDEMVENPRRFPDGRGPDLVHVWNPRESNRKFHTRLASLPSPS